MKKQLVTTITGEEKEVSINILNGEQMAELFEEHIDMSAKTDSDDILSLLKNPSGIFKFLNACFKLGVKGVDIKEVSGGTVQTVVQDNLQYMLDLKSNDEIKN